MVSSVTGLSRATIFARRKEVVTDLALCVRGLGRLRVIDAPLIRAARRA